jgi:hypothetical protein
MDIFLSLDYSYHMNETFDTLRKVMTAQTNGAVESDDKESERARLLAMYPDVYDTQELGAKFEVIGFAAPFCVVRRRSDGVKGSVMFQHSPRFYFNFQVD